MRIGLNTFLLSPGFSNKDIPLLQTFKDYGAEVIELAIVDPEGLDLNLLRSGLYEAGLENPVICGAFGPGRDLRGNPAEVENSTQYIKDLIRIAHQLDSDSVCGPFYSAGGRADSYSADEREQQQDQIAKNLKPLCTIADNNGVTLCMEPLNRFETDCINTIEQALELIERVDHRALKIHMDTFHMHIEESDSAAAIRHAGQHIGHVHVSASHRGVLGEDQVHWESVFSALADINYDGEICIETFSPDMAGVAKATSIWRKLYDSPEQFAKNGIRFVKEHWTNAQSRLADPVKI